MTVGGCTDTALQTSGLALATFLKLLQLIDEEGPNPKWVNLRTSRSSDLELQKAVEELTKEAIALFLFLYLYLYLYPALSLSTM